MHIRTPEITSKAVLKSPEGKLLEVGTAIVSLEERSVEFRSEFVQLFKMGTPLSIIFTKNDLETQKFDGEAYLSSQSMLRIVSVSDEILPGAKMAYMCSVELGAAITAKITEEIPNGFLNLKRSSVSRDKYFPAEIHNISMENIHFTTDKRMEKGQIVNLSIIDPPIKDIIVTIDKAYDFGQDLVNYHGTIKELRPSARIRLDGLLDELCNMQYKLF